MNANTVDFADVQGMVRQGFGKLKGATYALLRIKSAAAARAWLRGAPITDAVDPRPRRALQVAFTASGLAALEVPKEVIAGFSAEFLTGMTEESRARRLGDVGKNSPEEWAWGYGGKVPDLLVMIFADPEELADCVNGTKGNAWGEAFEELDWLETTSLDDREPFGFADGISQPQIDWERRRRIIGPQFDYTNIVALGEFLLGYPNEYNKYTDRPLVYADAASRRLLAAEDAPEKKDVGRNGTYLVLRTLQQDVPGFWQFVYERAGGNGAKAKSLAAAFVGRTLDGEPLVPIQAESIPGIDAGDAEQVQKNQFTFAGDPHGARCPFGAHVHRANPRNTDYPGRPRGLWTKLRTALGFGPKGFRDDLMSSVRFHRILRRGREYGPGLPPEDAFAQDTSDGIARGLHFLCLNANISRQFEFLQNAWMMSTKFSGLTGESDPLLGNRESVPGCPVTSHFTRPTADGVPDRVTGLPQFVTVRGGAYFFLPSLRAVRYFARAGNEQDG